MFPGTPADSEASTGQLARVRSGLLPTLSAIEILMVCTANQCRSPMAEALLRARLAERGVGSDEVDVSSAGLLPGGARAPAEARRAVPGIDDHVSRRLDPSMVDRADLVVAMAREHLREAAVLAAGAFARTFTLRDLVRRAEAVGPRGHDQPFDEWLAAIGRDRRTADYLRDDEDDDIADPIGRPFAQYEATAKELDDLITRFVGLAWP